MYCYISSIFFLFSVQKSHPSEMQPKQRVNGLVNLRRQLNTYLSFFS